MSRPKRNPENRVNTNLRLPADLHERLVAAASDRDLSVNWLVNRAIAEYLDRLIPVEELKWTRD